MSSNWVYSLDACAAAGILNYDAPADILGEKPRYYGNPDFESLETTLIPNGTKVKPQPQIDEFSTEDKGLVKNPTWKKAVFGGIIATALTGVALLLSKGKLKNVIPKLKDLGTNVLDYAKKGFNFIKTTFTNLINRFRHTP